MLGFDVEPAPFLERLTFAIGWLDASLWRSLRARRFAAAALSRVITARTTAGRLEKERARLVALLERMSPSPR